ncbi:sporulation integral membrane protein YtvI [Caldibacillus debilis]|uniref:Sporulation integral membrane protein YtvI n=1 Tax=Caldibacillus debilis TaxID=301148 RepID=A0A150LZK3_9BACI|nr:sporulation integral membrane protein YtvI [Caldibacillus debilis]KYD17717.1 hypothetical protein B4135_2388 [Caldibacillus debilis]
MQKLWAQVTRTLLVIGTTIVSLIALYFIASLTYPFIIAWFIAFLINPIVNFLQIKWRLPRSLAVLIVLVVIFALIATLFTLLVVELIAGTEYLAKTLPEHIQTFIRFLDQWVDERILPLLSQLNYMFDNLQQGYQDTITDNIKSIGANLASSIGALLQEILKGIPSFIGWFPFAGTVFLFIVLATFFFSKDWYKLKNATSGFIPSRFRKKGMSVYRDLRKALFGFIRAQLTLISITGVIVFIGLLVLKVRYALSLAFIIGFIDLLPYLGTGLVFVPWIIYEFITDDLRMGIGLTVLYVIVIVQRQLMEPKVVSTNIGVSPLATLIAIFVGMKLIGFLGIIAGPIVLVLITALHKARVFHEIWNFIKGNGASAS